MGAVDPAMASDVEAPKVTMGSVSTSIDKVSMGTFSMGTFSMGTVSPSIESGVGSTLTSLATMGGISRC